MEQIILSLLMRNSYLEIESERLKLQLLSHPEYPSLKSITDTLDYFEIENLAATVPKEALSQLPNAFLALVDKGQGEEVVLTERKGGKILITDSEDKKHKMSEAEFTSKWTGTIVAVEALEKTMNTKSLQSVLPYFIVAIVAAVNVTLNFSISYLLYTALTLVGLYISVLIIREDLGIKSKAVAKVCGAISKNSTCGDVITTKGNTILGIISLSDASFVFFAGLFLILSSIGFRYSELFALSLLSIPIIIYAIFRQGVVLKKWCALCLIVAGIIGLQTALLASTFDFVWTFNWVYVAKGIGLFLLMYVGWKYCKSYWESHEKLAVTQQDFLKFKRNPDLFKTMLKEQKVLNTGVIPNQQRIVFGNPNARIKIQGVTNPLCGFCTAAFTAYDKLMQTYGKELQLEFIFNVPTTFENQSTQIAGRLIDLYNNNPSASYAALQDWFAQRDINGWLDKHGKTESDAILETLKVHREWCNINDVHYTPASILNDYFFPKSYDIKDLPLFIQDIILEADQAQAAHS